MFGQVDRDKKQLDRSHKVYTDFYSIYLDLLHHEVASDEDHA